MGVIMVKKMLLPIIQEAVVYNHQLSDVIREPQNFWIVKMLVIDGAVIIAIQTLFLFW